MVSSEQHTVPFMRILSTGAVVPVATIQHEKLETIILAHYWSAYPNGKRYPLCNS